MQHNYFRLSREGITPKFLVDSPFGNIGYALFSYCFNYQFVGHVVIAINRYCVIMGTGTQVTFYLDFSLIFSKSNLLIFHFNYLCLFIRYLINHLFNIFEVSFGKNHLARIF